VSEPETTDLLIVGAGPTGLAAAFYAGMRGLTVRLVDPLEEAGGQLVALYPEKFIYDVVGFPKIKAAELAARLVAQLAPFHPRYALGERAERLLPENGGFKLTTEKGRVYRGRAVIIASGLGIFEPRRVGAEGELEFEGKGLEYALRDPKAVEGKRVLIVGGGDSALDWALTLKQTARVTLIHRRNSFRAHERSVEELRAAAEADELEVLTPYVLKAVRGGDRVEAVEIENLQDKHRRTLAADVVLILAGFLTKPGPIQAWGLTMDKGKIVVDTRMETNIPGVFAAGDTVTYPGKLKLLQVNFGEAATAANYAASYITGEKAFPGHSSDRPLTPS